MEPVPRGVVSRLPLYYRALALLDQEKVPLISSQDLGARLQLTPAQIRKDLSYFGRFGKQGRGYNVKRLLLELRRILGLDREWGMALVGVGRLGRAILGYGGFNPQGFKVIAAFDTDPSQIGKKIGNLTVQDFSEMPAAVKSKRLFIGIVAVPPPQAQGVINRLVSAGVKAILNYAPGQSQVPEGVHLREIDPVMALQSLTFYLKNTQEKAAR